MLQSLAIYHVADDKIDVSRKTVYVSTFQAKVCYLLLADVSIMRYKLTCLQLHYLLHLALLQDQ